MLVHIVIMGCGRTGASLAVEFEERGHTVAVIDRTQDAFRRLPTSFQGQQVTGLGFDRDTLISAGVEDAYAFAAVSSGDNSNILAARVVRETYGVDNVVARIADPGRAEVFLRLGIPTVAPVPWTTTQIVSRLLPGGSEEAYVDSASNISIRRLPIHKGWVGRAYRELEQAMGSTVAYVVRFGDAVLTRDDTLVQSEDETYFVVPSAAASEAQRVVSSSPGGS